MRARPGQTKRGRKVHANTFTFTSLCGRVMDHVLLCPDSSKVTCKQCLAKMKQYDKRAQQRIC